MCVSGQTFPVGEAGHDRLAAHSRFPSTRGTLNLGEEGVIHSDANWGVFFPYGR